MTYLIWIIATLLCLIGLSGVALPALPGTPLIFGATLLLAWWHNFEYLGWGTLIFSASLMILATIVDVISTALGAKKVGASKYAIIGSAIGTIIGLPFLLPGLIIGPFLGAICGELIVNQEIFHLGKVGFGTWLGLIVGTVIKVAIAFLMIGLIPLGILL